MKNLNRSNASRHGPPLRRASSPLGQLLAIPSAPRPLALSRCAPCASSRHALSLAMLSLAMIGSCYPWVHDCLCSLYLFVFTTLFVLLLYINPPVLARFPNQSTSPLASVPVLALRDFAVKSFFVLEPRYCPQYYCYLPVQCSDILVGLTQ